MTRQIDTGKIRAEELAASFQSLAPKKRIIVAVAYPLKKPPIESMKYAIKKLKYLKFGCIRPIKRAKTQM